MPLYEYECEGCGRRFELIQKFSDPPTAACVDCGGSAQRLLSAPAIQFKGSGWYVTDYANKSAPAPDPSAGSSNGGGEKAKDTRKDTRKEDSKPAGKGKSTKTSSSKS